MIFLADILTEGPFYSKADKEKKVSPVSKKDNANKKNKKATKQKKGGYAKLANKTAGVARFTEGEMAVVKSMVANDVKTPLKGSEGNQKTIGAKKSTKYHRSM